MRTIILALLVCAAAFGQCGALTINPVTLLLDCVGSGGGGSGTVTSVGLAGTAAQITVTGATPITTSGSWTLSIPSVLTLPGTVNKLTLTPPTTGATFTLADNSTLATAGAFASTLTFTGATNVTFPTTGTLSTTTGTVTSVATTSPITGGTITGTGTIACATCGVTGTGLQQFASTTSAQLAGVLSDETGSGLAVFGTSPTLTTPRIAAIAEAGGTNVITTFTNGRAGINRATKVGMLSVTGSTFTATGTVTTNGTTTIAGSGTLFTTELAVGAQITVNAQTRQVTAIASDTSLTVELATSSGGAGLSMTAVINPLFDFIESGGSPIVTYTKDRSNNWNFSMSTGGGTLSSSANASGLFYGSFLGVGGSSIISGSPQFGVTSGALGRIGEIIKGAASQTADFIQFQDSSAGVKGGVGASGGVYTTPVAVASLPTCAAGTAGMHHAVTDSNAASFTAGIGAVVVTGGSTKVPVYCDGTNWLIG